jgi:hypothetical protein
MARVPYIRSVLLDGETSVTTGRTFDLKNEATEYRTFMAKVSGTGAVSATVLVEVSNNNSDFFDLATITLSGTTSDIDGLVSDELWQYVRGRITAISGTGAAVTLTMAV